jgi:5-methylcytosine-specific restriction endonuclease McrA
MDYPLGETGPDEQLYALATGAPSRNPRRHEPRTMVERELRAKMRDGFACTPCGASRTLHVHHRPGTRSHRLRDLVTLCATCHKAIHYGQRR